MTHSNNLLFDAWAAWFFDQKSPHLDTRVSFYSAFNSFVQYLKLTNAAKDTLTYNRFKQSIVNHSTEKGWLFNPIEYCNTGNRIIGIEKRGFCNYAAEFFHIKTLSI